MLAPTPCMAEGCGEHVAANIQPATIQEAIADHEMQKRLAFISLTCSHSPNRLQILQAMRLLDAASRVKCDGQL